jgi:CelD/BcsL family acetyltransferase involved in cellulose biosynthesis
MSPEIAAESDPLEFQVVTDLAEILAIAPAWDALLLRSDCNRAFSSPVWFTAACRHNSSLKPHVITARRGRQLEGVLPLVLSDRDRVVAFPNYLSDYSDIIVSRGDSTVARGLLERACTPRNGYQRILLSNIRQDSNCLRALQTTNSRLSTRPSFREIVTCYYLSLPASHEDFLRTKGSRFRKRLKRLHCCADNRNFAMRELKPDSFPPDRLPEVFLQLHLERRNVKSCFELPPAQAFVTEVVPRLFKSENMRAIAMAKGDRLVGIDLYTMGRKSLCAWNGGFLAEAENCSPGKLLIEAGIKLALALKLEEYDFMRGPEVYKTSWANGSRCVGELEFEVAH